MLIDLGRGGYDLSSSSDPVRFDMDADGVPETITWTERDSAIAFLALDRNANRTVDNGRELFGNHTPLASGNAAAHGFEALAVFDLNDDGKIDDADPVWFSLLLWIDANHNGSSEEGELTSLADSAVTELGVQSRATWRRDAAGNVFRYAANLSFHRRGGVYYDVYFKRLQ